MTVSENNFEMSDYIDPYADDRIEGTAARMLRRYSSAKVAEAMAWDHAMTHSVGSCEAIYWRKVCDAIRRQRDHTKVTK